MQEKGWAAKPALPPQAAKGFPLGGSCHKTCFVTDEG